MWEIELQSRFSFKISHRSSFSCQISQPDGCEVEKVFKIKKKAGRQQHFALFVFMTTRHVGQGAAFNTRWWMYVPWCLVGLTTNREFFVCLREFRGMVRILLIVIKFFFNLHMKFFKLT